MIYQLVFGSDHATPVVNGAFDTREAAEIALSDRKANGVAFPNERIAEFNSPRPLTPGPVETCGQPHEHENFHPCRLESGHSGDHRCFWSSCGKTWKRAASDQCAPERKLRNADTPTSHLRNALQVSTLLAAELPKMIGNPGYQDDAKKALEGIDARIRAALDILEGGKV